MRGVFEIQGPLVRELWRGRKRLEIGERWDFACGVATGKAGSIGRSDEYDFAHYISAP